ncbi:hypothetical protein L1987_30043 [Smallanthus sonchifolius]|uniref:Uncharacterized protein n=1 Tax=Smallanthus sonchifolius TaxID=185202 RepID=A0ACB9I364_9ASTR|nr:hypothetical protein L1987_30043 [Smallanthus sonchifolius]
MVDDSSSDNLIRWGKTGNSFIVVDSLHISQSLLPAFFKHRNFSSFIRQLNTYIVRLKQEQKELEKEMLGISKRIEATERRPKQIIALLCLVAEDPEILPRMMLKTEQKRWSSVLVAVDAGGDDVRVVSGGGWGSIGVDVGGGLEDLDVRTPPPSYPLLGGDF